MFFHLRIENTDYAPKMLIKWLYSFCTFIHQSVSSWEIRMHRGHISTTTISNLTLYSIANAKRTGNMSTRTTETFFVKHHQWKLVEHSHKFNHSVKHPMILHIQGCNRNWSASKPTDTLQHLAGYSNRIETLQFLAGHTNTTDTLQSIADTHSRIQKSTHVCQRAIWTIEFWLHYVSTTPKRAIWISLSSTIYFDSKEEQGAYQGYIPPVLFRIPTTGAAPFYWYRWTKRVHPSHLPPWPNSVGVSNDGWMLWLLYVYSLSLLIVDKIL